MQLIADLTDKSVIRMPSPDMSAVGVALMAGMGHGMKSYYRRTYKIFILGL